MPQPEPTTPLGASRSEMRTALMMAWMGLLVVTLGVTGVMTTGGAALAWREGEDSVTFTLMAVLGYLIVVAAVFIFVESLRFLPFMVVMVGGLLLILAAFVGAYLLAMRPGPSIEVTPWALLGSTVVMFGIMQLMVLASTRWLRHHNDGQGVKAVSGIVGMFVVAAVGLAVMLVLDPDGKYLQTY